MSKMHNCNENIIYLKSCNDCIKKERDCKLSENGICSICGEIIITK